MAGKEKAKKKRGLGTRLVLLLLLVAGVIGFRAALNLPDEKRSRINKLMYEAKEMPFRLFV
jgi:hypothetical protein